MGRRAARHESIDKKENQQMSDNTTNNNASGNGNVAALREAVERSTRRLESLVSYIPPEWEKYVNADIRDNLAALALRPRNCDVGTTEEQAARMDDYCASHGERIGCSWRCDNCPLCSIDRCELAWAQMPYEEGGAE